MFSSRPRTGWASGINRLRLIKLDIVENDWCGGCCCCGGGGGGSEDSNDSGGGDGGGSDGSGDMPVLFDDRMWSSCPLKV